MVEILWQKLPKKELDCEPYRKRVLMFDPINLPNLFKPNPYKRFQHVDITILFPSEGGLCACGCKQVVHKPRYRWATDECQYFAVAIRRIVYGAQDTIASYLRLYYGWECSRCGCNDKGHDYGANGVVAWIKVDHIIPVKLGGGACWLSNYQLLCHDCHVGKTNDDFNWKKPIVTNQLPLFIQPNIST